MLVCKDTKDEEYEENEEDLPDSLHRIMFSRMTSDEDKDEVGLIHYY